jgi:GT2 family glycosyltransferase
MDGLPPCPLTPITVEVIVVSYNTKDLLRACLHSLRASSYPLQRTCVVDNASADGSAEMVTAEFPEVVLLRMPHNVGFARANNAAFARCTADAVLLLNSDAELTPAALGALVAALAADPSLGAVGPVLVGWDGRVQYEGGRNDPSIAGEFGNIAHLNVRLPQSVFGGYLVNDWNHRSTRDVEVLSGACMLLRREALAGHLFRADFFMYGEDVELCQRLRRRGWRVRYLAEAEVRHKGAAASRKARTRMRVAGVFSMARLLARRRGPLYAAGYLAVVPIAWPLGVLVNRVWPR